MDKLPFSIYDFYACLSAGFVVIAAADYGFNRADLLAQNAAFFLDLVLVIAAYIVGHVVAEFASYFYERRLVKNHLRYPTINLMGMPKAGRFWKSVAKNYFHPLPDLTRARVMKRAQAAGVDEIDDSLFFHCHATVKGDPVVLGRLGTFLNLYGFARNNSLAALIAGPVLIVASIDHPHDEASQKLWLGIAALLVAVALFYRYLKFFRLYALEVLVSYSEAPKS